VAFNDNGLIFTLCTGASCVKLYDVKNLSKGPFVTFFIPENSDPITHVCFSGDDKYMAVATEGTNVYLLDAFEYNLVRKFKVNNARRGHLGLSISPDSAYLLCGCDDGSIHVWSLRAGDDFKKVAKLDGHSSPVSCVKYNPEYHQFVSACSNVALWSPKENK
jgi:WD40 repeat protein